METIRIRKDVIDDGIKFEKDKILLVTSKDYKTTIIEIELQDFIKADICYALNKITTGGMNEMTFKYHQNIQFEFCRQGDFDISGLLGYDSRKYVSISITVDETTKFQMMDNIKVSEIFKMYENNEENTDEN